MNLKIKYLLAALPLLVGVFLFLVFFLGLDKSDELPSAIRGKKAPELFLSSFNELPIPSSRDLNANNVKLINFWASWCAPCRAEHAILEDIAAGNVEIYGINYKDDLAKATAFINELGNPYTKIGRDEKGKTGIEWGLYGVPETFVLGTNGIVLLRHPGPLTETIFLQKIKPLLIPN